MAKKNITFLIYKGIYPFQGVIRPFINFAKELSNKQNYKICFILLKCSRFVEDTIRNLNVTVNSFRSKDEALKYMKDIRPDFILVDDDPQKLKLVTKIKTYRSKLITYVQTLYGIHSVFDILQHLDGLHFRDKIIFKTSKLAPFLLFKRYYKNLLGRSMIVIANSRITATLLNILYGIESDDVIYPPVDVETFKPNNGSKRDKVLVYLGSFAGDTDKTFVINILSVLKNKSFEVLTMGNKAVLEKIIKNSGTIHISPSSDLDLAKFYSECKLVICPQLWEQLGYVPLESMACGTPVLAFDYIGPAETIIDGKTGWLAKNKKDFLNLLNRILNKEIRLDQNLIRRHVVKNFSSTLLAKKLEQFFKT